MRRTRTAPDMESFRSILKSKGLKATPQRIAVHAAMLALGHASADLVYEHIKKEGTAEVTVASVYNILSGLSAIGIYRRIPTSDNRLLRRIVRDFLKGAFTARETISNWPNVRRSEVKWIYPFQEDADVLFNSAYLVEFAVLRTHAERILATVPKNCPEYCEAHRLLNFLHYFVPVSDKEIPPTSLLRGFIGGGSF